ncbi:hypothetical protein CRUP_036541 [Coryphaenoides rupestris]|nr:hypothetical protein CRUP_036541 [Coryphaenoides rupestris]
MERWKDENGTEKGGYFAAATHSEDSPPVTDGVGAKMSSHGCLLACILAAALAGNNVSALMERSTERNCSINPPYLPVTVVDTTLRLTALRATMKPHSLAAYIIPSADAHLVGLCGTVVVTETKAVLWTDSRYWVQAERQMDCNWMLERDSSISTIAAWLLAEFPRGGKIGFDPFVFTPRRTWQMKVEEIRVEMAMNPYKPTALLLSALDETACKKPMELIGLFNLRGNDIPHNPFFYSYTLLTMQEIM